jgi:hypothetical protein
MEPRRARKTLICPVESLTGRALNIKQSKTMDSPSRIKGAPSNGNRKRLR